MPLLRVDILRITILWRLKFFVHLRREVEPLKAKTVGIELDMSKAYDRMECDFLEETLKAMSFHTKFKDVILACISSIAHSVLLNESPHGRIQPTRRVKPGM